MGCRVGDLWLEFAPESSAVASTARLRVRVRNDGKAPVSLERVALGFAIACDGDAPTTFLRNGWQSWSKCGLEHVGATGDASFPSGAWLRGMHHAVGERAAGRADWHESHGVSVATTGAHSVLAGILETGRQFGLVNLRRVSGAHGAQLEVELEWVVELVLAPGDTLALEDAWLALGEAPGRLLEDFATAWGRAGGARTSAPFQTGWCSWYHFFHEVTEEALLRNLEALATRRDAFPISLVQLDDGYQRAIGDWLETNAKFPRGLAFVADRIRDAGFEAGVWTAPFSAVRESRLLADHPDWALRGDDGQWLRGTLNPQWSAEGWCYALDPSHAGFVAHVEDVHRTLVEMGFSYHKLDFLYMASLSGRAADPTLTRAARLARGLDAVRRGAGDDAFLLGCGCPLGPAVGRVDGMRIGPDVAPTWEVDAPSAIPGIEPALPSTGQAIRSVAARLFMHRRLWLNDPDCLMVRRDQTRLSLDEIEHLADAIAASGGMVVFSDDVPRLGDDEAALLKRTIELGQAVDAGAPWGVARLASGLVESAADAGAAFSPGASRLARIQAALGLRQLTVDLNLGDAPLELEPGVSDEPHGAKVVLAPHASRLRIEETSACTVAVFCDFDGTFIESDVGSGLARTHLGARRSELHPRFESGELDAWGYVVELFDGFDLAEDERLAFLAGIELDPGARALAAHCAAMGFHFEVLSDGFDANIEWLRRRFALDFAFRSNHLEIGDTGWKLSPGGRADDCACGTGLCKRRVIRDWRRRHPGGRVVHVGNGRVSDLCAGLEADWTFAKDTLAPALDAAGRAHLRFETLHDVVEGLTRWLGTGEAPEAPGGHPG